LSASNINCHSFYYKWTSQNQIQHVSTGKDVQVKVTTKVTVSSTVEEMIDAVNQLLPDFLTHMYRIRHQYSFTKHLKDSLTHNECLIHIDFSENYTCKFSSETQRPLWSILSASIHAHRRYLHQPDCRKQQAAGYDVLFDFRQYSPWSICNMGPHHTGPEIRYRKNFLRLSVYTFCRTDRLLNIETDGICTFSHSYRYLCLGLLLLEHGTTPKAVMEREHRWVTEASCRSFGCPGKGYTRSTDTLRCSGWTDSHEVVLNYSKWHWIDCITVVKRVSTSCPSHNEFASSRCSSD